MPTFAYTARETASGREIRNTVDAATEQAAIAALLNRNLLVVEIREKMAKRGQTRGGRVQLADLVAYCASWGIRLNHMTKPTRGELEPLGQLVFDLRFVGRRFDEEDNQEWPVYGMFYLDDLRPSRSRM